MKRKILTGLLSFPLALQSVIVPVAAHETLETVPDSVIEKVQVENEIQQIIDDRNINKGESRLEAETEDLEARTKTLTETLLENYLDSLDNWSTISDDERDLTGNNSKNNNSAQIIDTPEVSNRATTASEVKKSGDFEYIVSDNNEVTISKYTSKSSTLKIPSVIEGRLVTTIGQSAFQQCSSLVSVSLPPTLKKIDSYAFSGTSLEEIDIPDSVTEIGYCLFQTSALKKVEYPAHLERANFKYSVDAMLGPFAGCINLKEVEIDEGVTKLPAYVFADNKNNSADKVIGLESIRLPSTLEEIGEYAFNGCRNLKTIQLSPSLLSLGRGCFTNCDTLETVDFNQNLEEIGSSAFQQCSSLVSVSLPPTLKKIDSYAFSGTSLEEIDIPDSVTEIGYCLFQTSTLKKVGYPAHLERTNFKYSVDAMLGPFAGCTNLKEVEIDEGVTKLPAYVFADNKNNSADKVIGLESIRLPSTLEEIGEYAFNGCHNLSAMIAPRTLTYIGKSNLLSVSEIYYEGTESEWNLIDIKDSDRLETITVYFNYFYGFKEHPDNPKEYYGPMMKKDFQNSCVSYLRNDANYPATLLVSEKDPKFGVKLTGFISHTLFDGIEGWEEQFLRVESIEAAQEILLGYISESSPAVEQVTTANKLFKLGKVVVEALKTFTSGIFLKDIFDGKMLDDVAAKINTSQSQAVFVDLLFEGDSDKIVNFFCTGTDISKDSMKEFLNTFYSSTEYIDIVNKVFKSLGYVGKITTVTSKTFNTLGQFLVLKSADEYYIDCLDYLSKNCSYPPVRTAASLLKDSLENDFNSIIVVLFDAVKESANVVIDGFIKDACTKLPPQVLLYKAAMDLGIKLGNALFGISKAQEAYDKLRTVAYMNTTLSAWVNEKNTAFKSVYSNGTEDSIQQYAESLMGALSLLATARENGEKVLRNYLNAYKFFGFPSPLRNNDLIRSSETVSAGIKSCVSDFDLKNNGAKYLSLCVGCPVDLSILSSDGSIVLTLKNGQIVAGDQDGIYYSVTENPLTGDSLKTISIPEGMGYSLRIDAVDLGAVDYMILSIDDNGSAQIRSLANIPVNAGDTILADQISFTSDLVKKYAEDGSEVTLSPILRDPENEVEVTGIETNPETVTIHLGETLRITPTIVPSDATASDVFWTSDNEEIAVVSDEGVVRSIGVGSTSIVVHALNGVTKTIPVQVLSSPDPDKPVNPAIDLSQIDYECTVKDPQVGEKGYYYTGNPITPKVSLCIDHELIEGTDYLLSYQNNIEIGTATILITGIGSYTGTINTTFQILKKEEVPSTIPISTASISGVDPQYTYTGKEITPKPVLKIDNVQLVENKDYKLSYSNNINPGEAVITITGMNQYVGVVTKSFTIVKNETVKPAVKSISMYRLYNPNSGEHFYTKELGEKNYLVSLGWTYEGEGWKAPEISNVPVYRLYNPNAGDHHYTMNAGERDNLVRLGWNYEGIGWYSDELQSVPLYRQYNPNAKAGSHNYTTSKGENDYLVSIGWNAEGIAWYGMK